MVDTGRIISDAQSTLVRRTLGGVTEDSAKDAIKQAATETDAEAQKEIRKAQDALDAKGRALVDMQDKNSELEKANRTLKDDRDSLRGENEKLTKTLDSRPRTREGKPSVLPNGNIKTIKTNSNGARMEIERTPDGRTISYTVENIDGDVRKTTVDPVSGKPVKTFDNTNGEDTLMEYTPNGVKMTRVNVKKEASDEPTIISKSVLVKEDSMHNTKTFKDIYSDGSYSLTTKWTNNAEMSRKSYYNKDGKLTKSISTENAPNNQREKLTQEINPETGNVTLAMYEYFDKSNDKLVLRNTHIRNDKGEDIACETTFSNGVKRILKAKTDEYGIVNKRAVDMEFIYPSSSKIKKTKTNFVSQFMPSNEIIKLRDGSEAVLDVDSQSYNLRKLTINKKGEEPVVIQDKKEIEEYLTSIGKLEFDELLNPQQHNTAIQHKYYNAL